MKRPPRPLHAALFAILLASMPAEAQSPLYRSVGPDGRIVFSDRKPTDPQLHTREVGKVTYAPLLTPSREPFDLRPVTGLQHPPRAGTADGLAPPVDISGKPFQPGLPDAILDVLVHQFFVQSLVETCGRVRPDAQERYQAGVLNWRQRNAEILDKSNRITFARFTGEQRELLRATGRARLDPLLPAANASDDERRAWCDRMGNDLARRQFELVGDLRVAPVVHYETP